MSLDQARLFIEKMKSEEAFRDRILAIKDVDARLAAASEAGFEFTEEEVKEVQSELSDDQLDGVSGGKVPGTGCMTVGLSNLPFC